MTQSSEPAPSTTPAAAPVAGDRPTRWQRLDPHARNAVIGAICVLAAAVTLFTRFTINGALSRDESIYVYGAQQFSRGVPPYVSIFDPKTPGATIIGGVAAWLARLVGVNDLHAIRWTFFVLSVLTALAIYFLALELWHSVAGAAVAGIAFCCLTQFAQDALIGPDAKTPGVLFFVVSMWLMVRRRFLAAGILAGLAFAVWQPLFWYALIAIIAAAVHATPGRKLRAAAVTFAGAAAPTLLLAAYFLIAGGFRDFVVTAFVYPLTGTKRAHETLSGHFVRIATVINADQFSAALIWTGAALLVVLVIALFVQDRAAAFTAPLFLIVFLTFFFDVLYAVFDFQGGPDTLPFLPYAALGIGGAVATLLGLFDHAVLRRALVGAVAALAVVLASSAWAHFGTLKINRPGLLAQMTSACGVTRLVKGQGPLIALGNPVTFALTHKRSSTRFIYLQAGVDAWKVNHTNGGITTWERHIVRSKPAAIAMDGWHTAITRQMISLLKRDGYRSRYIGRWRVWLDEAAQRHARAADVELTPHRTAEALNAAGVRLPSRVPCEKR